MLLLRLWGKLLIRPSSGAIVDVEWLIITMSNSKIVVLVSIISSSSSSRRTIICCTCEKWTSFQGGDWKVGGWWRQDGEGAARL